MSARARKRTRRAKAAGLRLARRFSRAGVHPFDELEWDLRSATITNERGEVIFEQLNCEIPKSWSQLATNVVVSKYFRGGLGTPEREHSVRQLVGRVADTIADWGLKDGTFASPHDGEVFRAELTHLLVNQLVSFNSPVWFNVGVEKAPQCSACFINSVQDSMASMWRERRQALSECIQNLPERSQEILRLKYEQGLQLVIDYLQLMKLETGAENRQQEVSEISRSLKAIAQELHIPVIAISQLSRQPETGRGSDHRPQLSDLRESGAIEQDADLVVFIYRPEMYEKDKQRVVEREIEGKAEIIIAKQRNGRTDTVHLYFVKQCMRFETQDEFPEL